MTKLQQTEPLPEEPGSNPVASERRPIESKLDAIVSGVVSGLDGALDEANYKGKVEEIKLSMREIGAKLTEIASLIENNCPVGCLKKNRD